MISKQVLDRRKSALAVITAAETYADLIGRAFNELARPLLASGEELPDAALRARLQGRVLQSAIDALVAADEAHIAELGDDQAHRDQRDACAGELYEAIVRMRGRISASHGAKALQALGFKGDTPRDPAGLASLAVSLAAALRTQTLPAVTDPYDSPAPVKQYAILLEDLAAKLEAQLASVAREEREGQQTLVRKLAAMEAYDRTFMRVARSISAELDFCGESGLADRLRPSKRRPGLTTEDAEKPEEAAPRP
jgi:hypothetical protein